MASLAILRSTLSNDILRDPNNRVRPLDIVDRALNNAYDRLQEDLLDMESDGEDSTTITTDNGTQTYVLPADFLKVKGIRYNNSPLSRTSRKEIKNTSNINNIGKPAYYYLYQGKLGLYPVPDGSYTIELDYTAKLPAITLTQDSLNPSYLDKALVYIAGAELYRQVMQIDRAQMREIEYEKAKDKAMLFLIGDENLVYGQSI